jgi:hypothetical protein
MTGNRHEAQFLCNAQVCTYVFPLRFVYQTAKAFSHVTARVPMPNYTVPETVCIDACLSLTFSLLVYQPPYVLQHANALWCQQTGFTPLMIKGSHGLSLLKGPNTDEQIVESAWGKGEKTISVIHYTGTHTKLGEHAH